MELDERYLTDYVKKQISPERYIHSMNTASEAADIASHYGEDVEKARIAGILHDVGKGHADQACTYGVPLDAVEAQNPELAHGRVGAAMVCADLGIDDPEILSAITWHTTGKACMSALDKIIYLADIIEPGRTFSGVEKIRSLVYKDLDAAMICALEEIMSFVCSRGLTLHPKSEEAYQYLKELEEQKKLGLS